MKKIRLMKYMLQNNTTKDAKNRRENLVKEKQLIINDRQPKENIPKGT